MLIRSFFVAPVCALLWSALFSIKPVWAQEQKPSVAAVAPLVYHTLLGDVRQHKMFHSRFVKADRDVWAYLPPGYDDAANRKRRYPVLYLHDGQNIFDGATAFITGKEWRADETAESLIARRQIEPVIIIAVANAGGDRMKEYTPVADAKYGGGGAYAYGRMLADDLKPFIDRTYRTKPDTAHTAIGGSSLGGLASLHLALARPDVWGKVAVLSPSVWWAKREILTEVAAWPKARALPPVYLSIGGAEDKDGDALSGARALRDALVTKGWTPGANLLYAETENAAHNEEAWAARVPGMLRFLFPANKPK